MKPADRTFVDHPGQQQLFLANSSGVICPSIANTNRSTGIPAASSLIDCCWSSSPAASSSLSGQHKMTAAKFEPGSQQQQHPNITGIHPSILPASALGSSSASTITASSSSASLPPYCWAMAGHEWELAARTAAAEAHLSLSSQPCYGQMAAAAAISAASAASTGPAAWYPPVAAAGYGYYGLAQRSGTAMAATQQQNGGYPGGVTGPYSGPYMSPADYYPYIPYYAAALNGASSVVSYNQQQYMATAGGMNAANDLQAGATGSELDSPPLGPVLTGRSPPAQICQNGSVKEKTGSSRAEKKSASSSSKRSKKKKGAVRCSPTEPNNTRVFIWELEDICAVFPPNSPYRSYTEQWLTATLEKLLLNGFQLDNSAEEFDQANLEDAQLDEALQNAANCGGLSSSAPTAFLPGGEGLDEVNQQQPQPMTGHSPAAAATEGDLQQSTQATANGTGPRQSAISEGLRRLAAKSRLIRDIYNQHGGNRLAELLEQCGLSAPEFFAKLDQLERMPGANLNRFRDCLRVIAERSARLPNRCANIVLSSNGTESGVAGALGRLMLCRMGQFVQAEHVFCTARTGKEAALERLASQFQKKLLLVITGNEETHQLAKREGVPCWFLYSDLDLVKFRSALDILVGDLMTVSPTLSIPPVPQQQAEQQQQASTTAVNNSNYLTAVRG